MKIVLLAIRSLMRFRLYTVINILGLALSLTCVIIISRYVYSEAKTDRCYTDYQNIYLSVRHWPNGDRTPRLMTMDNVLMKRDFVHLLDIPEVARKTSFVSLFDVTVNSEGKNFGAHVLATDTVFLQLFDYPMVEGSRLHALSDPKSAVITQSFARKLFGSKSPIGKNLQYNEHLLTIQGVVGEPATQSSLTFDVLVSQKLQWRWPPINYYTAALLVEGSSVEKINKQLKDAFNHPDNKSFLYQLFPLKDLYLNNTLDKGENMFRQGNLSSLHILSIVGILILIVGVLNFIHINSVVILKRGRELGMKKVFGASPRQLFVQLFAENLALTAVALLVGWALIEITSGLQVNVLRIPSVTPPGFGLAVSLALLIGLPFIITLYPFFRYCYRRTITSLQGIQPKKNSLGGRPVFLVAQYCITVCLIVSALFFTRQLDFMLNADTGYRTKDIIKAWFRRPSSVMIYSEEDQKLDAYNNKRIDEAIKSSPLFTSWCFGISPYEFTADIFNLVKARKAGGEWQDVLFVKVKSEYFDLYKIHLTGDLPVANDEVIANVAAGSLITPNDDLGTIEIQKGGEVNAYSVKGIIPDIQTVHLSRHNLPLILTVEQTDEYFYQGKCMAAIVPGRRQEAIRFLKELHDELIGGEFEYSFVEDEIQTLYDKDKQVAFIYSVFALIAILISSLGLFGLSLFDIQQRYKEIAIRKVNGATTTIIAGMLLRKYYLLLGIAFLIATPLSWLAISKYMESYANKAPLSWWIFAIAFLITACISLFTLIWQIRKAARTNPAEAIKTE